MTDQQHYALAGWDTPHPAKVLGVPPAGANGMVAKGRYRLVGWSLQNNGAAAATFIFYDGESATGNILGVINLAAQATDNAWFGDRGVACDIGIWSQSGGVALRGSLYVVPLWQPRSAEYG